MTTFANLACALFLASALARPRDGGGRRRRQRSDPRRNTDKRRGRRSHERLRVGERCGQQAEPVVGDHGRNQRRFSGIAANEPQTMKKDQD